MTHITPADLSILLVEPSDTQQKIIVGKLAKEGINQVVTAKSITEAFDMIERHPPDLVASAMYFDDGTALDLLKKNQIKRKAS